MRVELIGALDDVDANVRAAAAEALGYPVVLKIESPDILHKTEAGGVIVGVKSADEAVKAYDTILANALVNRMGAGFAQLWADDHGLSRAEVLKAYATAHQVYGGDGYWAGIEALDNQLPAATQYRLMNLAIGLLKHATGWFASTRWAALPVQDAIARFVPAVAAVEALLPELLPPAYRDDWDRSRAAMVAEGVPDALAQRLANARALGAALDIAELAEQGFPGYEDYTWIGFFAPAGAPKAIVERLNKSIGAIVVMSDVKERLAASGFDPVSNTAEQFAAYVREEVTKWAKVIKESGAKAD